MANLIPQEKIEEIKHASDIVQIISEYITLKQRGKSFVGLCPFHAEKTPSFTVDPEKKLFYCFGCGEGGTVFTFIMKQEGVDFAEAVKLAASKAHIDLSHLQAKTNSCSTTEKSRLLNATGLAAKYFHAVLQNSEQGRAARDYLQHRHINGQSIKNFSLGYSPNAWDALIKACRERNVAVGLLEKAGLAIPKKEGNSFYDRFRNRLMFPICDARKQVIGFGGRALDDALPKYLNSPETVLFNKSNVLYGIDVAKSAIVKQRRAILMEGYTDVIMAHQHGIEWAVAVLGTAISKQHLRQLRQYCSQVILLMDSDAAGQKSSDRSLDIFVEEEFDVKIAQLPKDYDPCDFLIEEGAEKFLAHVNAARDFFSFKVEMAASKWDMATIHGRANAINDVLSTAMKSPDPIKRNLLVKMIAEEMSIDEAALRTHLSKLNKPSRITSEKQAAVPRMDASSRIERELLYLMVTCNDFIPRVLQEIGMKEFHNADFSNIAEKIVALYQKTSNVKESDVLHALDSMEHSKLMMDIIASEEFKNIADRKGWFEACIAYFQKRNNRQEIHRTKKKTLETLKVAGSEEALVVLLDEYHKKHRNKHTLKNKN